MDKDTRNAIERATQKARRLLEQDFAEQLDGVFDVRPDGRIASKGGAHLTGRQHLLRDKVVAAIEHKRSAGMRPEEAVADYVRDAAFTALNRFAALKMLEARDLVQECVSRGDNSTGFVEFCGLAPALKTADGAGYRLYIESIFDELSTEVKVLFDRRDPASVLWPTKLAFDDLLAILNHADLAGVWSEDETIGWIYQFFNSDEERRQMRVASQAPRNTRELAIRNQFFTPRYVVEFLTDNTLGRIWDEMRKGDTSLAQVCKYTIRRPGETFVDESGYDLPDAIPDDLTQDELWQRQIRLPHRPQKDPRDIRILDPACGSGHFLLYCFVLLLTIYEEAWSDAKSPASEATGTTLRQDFATLEDLRRALPGLILRHNLHGVDIDARCAQIAQLALWMRAQRERPVIRRVNIVIAEPMPGEKELLTDFLGWLKEDRLEVLLRRTLEIPPGQRVTATKAMADSLANLVTTVWDGMKLAGEMGTLLRLEQDLARAVENPSRRETRSPRPYRPEASLDRDPAGRGLRQKNYAASILDYTDEMLAPRHWSRHIVTRKSKFFAATSSCPSAQKAAALLLQRLLDANLSRHGVPLLRAEKRYRDGASRPLSRRGTRHKRSARPAGADGLPRSAGIAAAYQGRHVAPDRARRSRARAHRARRADHRGSRHAGSVDRELVRHGRAGKDARDHRRRSQPHCKRGDGGSIGQGKARRTGPHPGGRYP
jgi:hypothetical protein